MALNTFANMVSKGPQVYLWPPLNVLLEEETTSSLRTQGSQPF